MTFIEFQDKFSNEIKCKEYFFELKWPEGHVCESCGSKEYKKISTRNKYYCCECAKQFSLTKDTIMEGTKLELRLWFCAIYLMAKDKRGISNLQLSKELKINYRSALLMTRNIKNVMSQRDMEYMLEGIIDMDECFIGRPSGKSGRGTNKAKVLVALSSTKDNFPQFLKLKLCDNLQASTINSFVTTNIKSGSFIRTDEYSGYNDLIKIGMDHYSEKYEKDGDFLECIHTVVANLKSYILGTYHGLSQDNLQVFLDEFCYRFNRRFCTKSLFDRLISLCTTSSRLRRKDICVFAHCT